MATNRRNPKLEVSYLDPGEALNTIKEDGKVARGKGASVLSLEDAKDLYVHEAISRTQFAEALRNRKLTPDQIEHEASVCEQQRILLQRGTR